MQNGADFNNDSTRPIKVKKHKTSTKVMDSEAKKMKRDLEKCIESSEDPLSVNSTDVINNTAVVFPVQVKKKREAAKRSKHTGDQVPIESQDNIDKSAVVDVPSDRETELCRAKNKSVLKTKHKLKHNDASQTHTENHVEPASPDHKHIAVVGKRSRQKAVVADAVADCKVEKTTDQPTNVADSVRLPKQKNKKDVLKTVVKTKTVKLKQGVEGVDADQNGMTDECLSSEQVKNKPKKSDTLSSNLSNVRDEQKQEVPKKVREKSKRKEHDLHEHIKAVRKTTDDKIGGHVMKATVDNKMKSKKVDVSSVKHLENDYMLGQIDDESSAAAFADVSGKRDKHAKQSKVCTESGEKKNKQPNCVSSVEDCKTQVGTKSKLDVLKPKHSSVKSAAKVVAPCKGSEDVLQTSDKDLFVATQSSKASKRKACIVNSKSDESKRGHDSEHCVVPDSSTSNVKPPAKIRTKIVACEIGSIAKDCGSMTSVHDIKKKKDRKIKENVETVVPASARPDSKGSSFGDEPDHCDSARLTKDDENDVVKAKKSSKSKNTKKEAALKTEVITCTGERNQFIGTETAKVPRLEKKSRKHKVVDSCNEIVSEIQSNPSLLLGNTSPAVEKPVESHAGASNDAEDTDVSVGAQAEAHNKKHRKSSSKLEVCGDSSSGCFTDVKLPVESEKLSVTNKRLPGAKKRLKQEAIAEGHGSCSSSVPSAVQVPAVEGGKKSRKHKLVDEDLPVVKKRMESPDRYRDPGKSTFSVPTDDSLVVSSSSASVVKPVAVNDCYLGQWATATFDANERLPKFVRLLGGMKNKVDETDHTTRFQSLRTSSASTAMSGTEEKQLNQSLESQFNKALGLSLHSKKRVGLGFEPAPETGKKIYIDKGLVRSKTFDDDD